MVPERMEDIWTSICSMGSEFVGGKVRDLPEHINPRDPLIGIAKQPRIPELDEIYQVACLFIFGRPAKKDEALKVLEVDPDSSVSEKYSRPDALEWFLNVTHDVIQRDIGVLGAPFKA